MKYRLLRSFVAAPIKQLRSMARRSELDQRKTLARRLPSDPSIRAAAQSLERDGFVRLDNLVDPVAMGALASAAQLKVVSNTPAMLPEGVSRKPYWNRLLDSDLVGGAMPSDTAFTRFALQPRLLAMLAETFGTLPLLDYVLLTHSQPSESPLSQSQLWHRDHDDVRTIKLFVYLTDVLEEGCGPFTFLPGPQSDAAGRLGASHASDLALSARANPSDVEQMFAPALSTFAVETSRCLHMGSRVEPRHDRVLFTATYITLPRIFASQNRFMPLGEGSPIERAVLGEALS